MRPVDQSAGGRKECERMWGLKSQSFKGIASGEKKGQKRREKREATWRLVCLGCCNAVP